MSSANSNPPSTTSDDSSWLLISSTSTSSDVSYVPSEAGSSEQHYSINPSRNRRRIERAEESLYQLESCRAMSSGTFSTANRAREAHETARTDSVPLLNSSDTPRSAPTTKLPSNMTRTRNTHSSPRGQTSASREFASPGAAWGSRAESSAGRRRHEDGSSAQDWSSVAATVDSSGPARREEPGGGGSVTARAYGSGSSADSGSGAGSSSSARRESSGGAGLTERNVSQASEFYEQVRRNRDKISEPEQAQTRVAAAQAELAEINKKLSDGGR
ncbi:hypothetical protein N657DRAFT_676761 [Parathielavia appendiculata]|uniref:Uncharacterized protein n=1 Tax=Parathielavia appendiculata TaxID=2587402 RepID=A0AAN6Z914_9PEZI|nr:hypothetical protein N657DRAFT_676761 [Parathielavia appendiculata]